MAANIITHTQPEISTVGEFLSNNESLIKDLTAQELIEATVRLDDDSFFSNRDSLFRKYSDQRQINRNQSLINQGEYESLDIEVGTQFAVLNSNLERETLFLSDTPFVSPTNAKAFISSQLERLLRDPNYSQIERLTEGRGSIESINTDVSVYIWIRSLSPEDGDIEGSWFDISPYIIDQQTSVGESGGRFSITLPPTLTAYNSDEGWELSNIEDGRGEYLGKGNINYFDSRSIHRRSNFFFHTAIQENDLIYIRFERLNRDQNQLVNNGLDSTDVVGNTYDMIGLIDSSSIITSSESNNVSVQITGRDLIKVLIEDGSYFFPLEFAFNIYNNTPSGQVDVVTPTQVRTNEVGKLVRRSRVSGEFTTLNAYVERSIQFSLKFIISQLSNSGLVPNHVFSGYPDSQRNKRFRIDEESTQQSRARQVDLINRYKSEAETNIRLSRVNDGITNPNSETEVAQVFLEISRFLTAVDEAGVGVTDNSGVIVNWGVFTYNGQSLVESEFPNSLEGTLLIPDGISVANEFAQEAILSVSRYLYNLNNLDTFQGNFSRDLADGVWQIIDLVVDPSVVNRRIVDSSIAMEQGSILNSINKVCQRPFVEFITDTYGDRFTFIVRKPPFDREGAVSLIYDQIKTDQNIDPELRDIIQDEVGIDLSEFGEFDKTRRISDLVLDISEEDVLQESLTYDTEVYSWYHIKPQGFLFGTNQNMTLAYIPAIFFEEYNDVWGSRPYVVTDNYIPFRSIDDTNFDSRQQYVERQAALDLLFMIESTQYLPFTRRGTIVIKGNRTFKRGTYINYSPTNEIFYVDGVSNTRSISSRSNERFTVLNVSRGMVEPFIRGVDITFGSVTKNVSYFNIINASINDFDRENIRGLKNWRVDQDIFNFFLKRNQWRNLNQ